MKVVLKNVRLAFPALFEAKAFEEGEARHSAILIFDPKSPNVKALRDATTSAAKEVFKDKATTQLATMKKKDRLALKEEPYANKDGETYDGFDGMFWIRASNVARPTVKDRDGTTPLTEKDGRPYAGCYVNASIDVWAQNNKWGQRINAKLLGVQFVKDGEAFSAGASFSEDDFEALDDEGDYDDSAVSEEEGADDLA